MRNILERIIPLFTVTVLAVFTFIFFRNFFDNNPSNFTIEILAAILGSILTITITMVVLKKQGEIQDAYEQASVLKTKILEEKLNLYSDFVDAYTRANFDGKLDLEELDGLERIALKIFFFTKNSKKDRLNNLGELLCRFVYQLEVSQIPFNSNNIDKSIKNTLEEKIKEIALKHKDSNIKSDPIVTFPIILKAMKQDLGILDEDKKDENNSLSYPWLETMIEYRNYRDTNNI